MRPWRRATALMLGVLISMTACGLGSDETSKLEPRLQRMVPTGTPAVAVMPRDGQPAETRQVTGKFFSMYVPANFQEVSSQTADGEKIVGFTAPSSKPATPIVVAVVPDTKPKATVIEQMYAVEVQKQIAGVEDLTRSTVKWPGAQSAILLQWTETPAGAVAADARQRHWQIAAQVNDHLIVSINAIAPVKEFDTAGLAKIMETFRPHA